MRTTNVLLFVSRNGGGGLLEMRRCQVMVFEKPEEVMIRLDEALTNTQRWHDRHCQCCPFGIVDQEQSYSSLHSGWSLAWDHFWQY